MQSVSCRRADENSPHLLPANLNSRPIQNPFPVKNADKPTVFLTLAANLRDLDYTLLLLALFGLYPGTHII